MKLKDRIFRFFNKNKKARYSTSHNKVVKRLDPSLDAKNIRSDWEKVGSSISAGINQYKKEIDIDLSGCEVIGYRDKEGYLVLPKEYDY